MIPTVNDIKKRNIVFLFEHYIDIIENTSEYINTQQSATTADAMVALCKSAIAEYDTFHAIDDDNAKVNRWLGYIQGMLICIGLLTIEDERNFTRPYLTAHRAI